MDQLLRLAAHLQYWRKALVMTYITRHSTFTVCVCVCALRCACACVCSVLGVVVVVVVVVVVCSHVEVCRSLRKRH